MKAPESMPSDQDLKLIHQILATWFEDTASGRMDVPQVKRWFMGGKTLDKQLTDQYGAIIDQMLSGVFDHWNHTADGALASILVLDQFNRNINRGTAKAFSGDAKALAISRHSLAQGYPDQCALTQRVFFYMPFEHDESKESQQQAVDLMTALAETAEPELAEFANATLASAIEHQEIIEQFGRYPHRNEALNRPDTPKELAWLAQKGKRFGQ